MLISLRNHDQTLQKSSVIVSVDIPSGWHVEGGDVGGEGIRPDMLVGLEGNFNFVFAHDILKDCIF